MIVTRYYEALNLERNPFSLTPDLNFYFLMSSHVEAIDTVFFAFDNGAPMVRLYGEPGMGKTMLLKYLAGKFREKYGIDVNYMTYNPLVDVKSFAQDVLDTQNISDIEGAVKSLFEKRGGRIVIFVDEAQDMSYEHFLLLKYIIDFSASPSRAFVLLSGTPVLKEKFSRDEMLPLAQRAPYHCKLYGLKKEEVKGYIEHRMKKSGFSGDVPFKGRAIKHIWKLTGGNPRKVNILAERSILAAMVKGKRTVGKKEVKEAYKDISDEILK